ncbi:MAG: hopanoid biosynthesis-associated protein HpnK [Elusimicrobia bacterium]|nr:hopanoid biosynthesis-associated protein HpnK [Elusimicrobiota bacterium]
MARDVRGLARRLIVTADDFGLSGPVNEAVVRGFREGILRYASLMVAEPGAEEAVARARRECPGLGLGLHLVLCSGRAVLASSRDAGLAGADGRFPEDPVRCGLRYYFDRSLAGALEAEARAQFERFLAFGLRPGHVDGHLNIQVHPVVYPLVVRLSGEYGFGRVRLPGGEVRASLAFSGPGLWPRQLLEGAVFEALRTHLTRACAEPGVAVADRTFGLLRSGLMDEGYVLSALRSLGGGLSELYFHPSVEARGSGHHGLSDLETLLSPRVRRALDELGIDLVAPPR